MLTSAGPEAVHRKTTLQRWLILMLYRPQRSPSSASSLLPGGDARSARLAAWSNISSFLAATGATRDHPARCGHLPVKKKCSTSRLAKPWIATRKYIPRAGIPTRGIEGLLGRFAHHRRRVLGDAEFLTPTCRRSDGLGEVIFEASRNLRFRLPTHDRQPDLGGARLNEGRVQFEIRESGLWSSTHSLF